MTRTSLADFNCSLARTVDVIGDKWSLMILRDAFYGVTTFSAFKDRLGITQAVLSSRLSALVEAQILKRVQPRENVERFEYRLTDRGRELLPVILSIVQWGDKWVFGADKHPINVQDKATKSPIKRLRVEDQLGRPLAARDLHFAPGKGANEDTFDQFRAMGVDVKAQENGSKSD